MAARSHFRFHQASASAGLQPSSGLSALGSDANKVTYASSISIVGSANVDSALAEAYPNDSRWDYAIGLVRHAIQQEELVWLEVHSATTAREIEIVLNKHNWLIGWLSNSGRPMNYKPRRFVWVASGKVGFAPDHPGRRELSKRGVVFSGCRLHIK